MQGKYFTVEVKPEIRAVDTGISNGTATNDDVLFSWTPFEVPRGSSRLLGVTVRVAGTDGVKQETDFQLFFAKSANYSGVLNNNPLSIGAWSATAVAVPSKNEHLGSIKINTQDYLCQSTPGMSVASTGNHVIGGQNASPGNNVDMILTPSRNQAPYYYNNGTKVPITAGADILWVAGIACGTFDFVTTVTTDLGGPLAVGEKVVHTDTKDANLVFSPGDVIQEADNTIVGTVASIGSPTGTDCDITLESGIENVLADGVILYPRHPITMELMFEK